MTCGVRSGVFKSSHVFKPQTFVLFIIFVNYYMLNAFEVAQWRMNWLVRLVTWVRAPGFHFLHIIFQLTIRCRHNVEDYDTLSQSNVHASNRIQSKAKNGDTRWVPVSAQAHYLEKSNGLRLLGQNFHNLTSYLGATTPFGLQILLTFFILFFFINCFIN